MDAITPRALYDGAAYRDVERHLVPVLASLVLSYFTEFISTSDWIILLHGRGQLEPDLYFMTFIGYLKGQPERLIVGHPIAIKEKYTVVDDNDVKDGLCTDTSDVSLITVNDDPLMKKSFLRIHTRAHNEFSPRLCLPTDEFDVVLSQLFRMSPSDQKDWNNIQFEDEAHAAFHRAQALEMKSSPTGNCVGEQSFGHSCRGSLICPIARTEHIRLFIPGHPSVSACQSMKRDGTCVTCSIRDCPKGEIYHYNRFMLCRCEG